MWKEQQKHEDARNIGRTEMLDERLKGQIGEMVQLTFGRARQVRRVDRNGEALIWCRKCSFWLCATQTRTKAVQSMQAEEVVHERILILEQERVPAKSARGWKIAGQTRRVTKKEYKRLREEFQVGGFMAQQR